MRRAWIAVGIAALIYPALGVIAVPTVSLLAIVGLTCCLVAVTNDRSFSRPMTVFAPFFCLYSVWFPVSVMAGPGAYQLFGPVNWEAITLSLNLAYLGLLTFAIVGLLVGNYREVSLPPPAAREVRGVGILLVLNSLIVVGAAVEAALLGAGSKQDVLANMGIFGRMGAFAGYFIAAGLTLVSLRYAPNWRRLSQSWETWLTALALVVAVAVLGERDMLFRCVAIGAIIYFSVTHRAGNPTILIIMAAAIIAAPLTQQAKSILLSGRFVLDVNEMFLGEFFSAGRNAYHLIDVGVQHSFSYLWSDILRALSPLTPGGAISTGAWYHQIYRPEHNLVGSGSGWGFGYVAQGFLIGSEVGVVIVLATVSVVVHATHRLRLRSIFWFAFYALTISTAIYCIRADIANLLSQTFKIGGVAVLTYYVLDLCSGRVRHFTAWRSPQ